MANDYWSDRKRAGATFYCRCCNQENDNRPNERCYECLSHDETCGERKPDGDLHAHPR
jgi:hypothetical protein